ncbi:MULTISPECIES: DUF1307 domain-containing protein [unclassified Nosocomiicoccus]|uniref:DUF1307 domain-containing protein n=1 Tax=unclassified Nosocomiicoccus TaxID=2646683 RepID=UPI0008A24CD3|nr:MULTISPECIES: DUF1307 domain-containing protein [unclassified Nosocomiicoccus]OFL47310.1 hypothetical protein HMPREF2767_03920 [Nosocomiicoccus sp. HMSC067E10]OFO49061.1 hypothetical protein HMPREF3029_02645 [Nosocomiicoccus sp. HMSC059G07]
MKKLFSIFLSLAVLVTLAACSNDDNSEEVKSAKQQEPVENKEETSEPKEEESETKEETVTYEKEEQGILVTVDLIHKGEELIRQVTTTKADYEAINVSNKDEAKQRFEDIDAFEAYEGEEGLNYDVEFKEDHFIETIEVEYSKISPEKLNELVRPAEDNKTGEIQKISLDLTIKELEQAGFKLKEK